MSKAELDNDAGLTSPTFCQAGSTGALVQVVRVSSGRTTEARLEQVFSVQTLNFKITKDEGNRHVLL